MYKKAMIIGCALCFAWGFSHVYVRRIPLNPDVRATVKALRIGMAKQEAIPIMRMSFLLKESPATDCLDSANGAGQPVSIVSGVMPGRAYRYFVKAGFSKDGRLVNLDYCSRKGWLWLFHRDLTAHGWQGNRPGLTDNQKEKEP